MAQKRVKYPSAEDLFAERQKIAAEITARLPKDAFVPGKREQKLLQDLFDWEERSRRTNWVLGKPVGYYPVD